MLYSLSWRLWGRGGGPCGTATAGRGSPPWGMATIDLKTPECGHHTLCLSHSLQTAGGNSHDDRSGRLAARPPLGQACPRESTHDRRGDGGLGWAVSPGGATRHGGRAGPCLPSRARRCGSGVSRTARAAEAPRLGLPRGRRGREPASSRGGQRVDRPRHDRPPGGGHGCSPAPGLSRPKDPRSTWWTLAQAPCGQRPRVARATRTAGGLGAAPRRRLAGLSHAPAPGSCVPAPACPAAPRAPRPDSAPNSGGRGGRGCARGAAPMRARGATKRAALWGPTPPRLLGDALARHPSWYEAPSAHTNGRGIQTP